MIIDDAVVGRVWIERDGHSLALDDMLVDRMALTASIILQPRRSPTNAEHTRNLLFPMDEMAVLTSCAALKIDPVAALRIVACVGNVPSAIVAKIAMKRTAAITVDYETFYLVERISPDSFDDAVHVGVSLAVPASDAHRYVGNARFALRQTSDSDPVVFADELGALNLLEPGNDHSRTVIPDLITVDLLAETPQGRELLNTLRMYLNSGTLRSAADRMHLHHSSVAHRLAKLSTHLGYPVDALENRARATAMMMLTPGLGDA